MRQKILRETMAETAGLVESGPELRTIGNMTAVDGVLPIRRPRHAGAVAMLARRAATSIKDTASRLSASILTVAGLGCVDTGAFLLHPVAGWMVTGLSLFALEFRIDGEGGQQ